MEVETLHKVSPTTGKTLKPVNKISMIFFTAICGADNGFIFLFMKYISEIMQEADVSGSITMIVLLGISAVILMGTLLFCLNYTMRDYE